MRPAVRLRAGDRTLTVELPAAAAGGGTARVDGAGHDLRCLGRAAGGGGGVEELTLDVDGHVVRALVARRPGHVLVALDGHVYRFTAGAEDAAAGAAGPAGSGVVVAPMPGKVVAILVCPGDAVAPGQPLVVLEAMKMESTLTAEVTGHVAAVHAEAGATVDAGAVLVEIRAGDAAE